MVSKIPEHKDKWTVPCFRLFAVLRVQVRSSLIHSPVVTSTGCSLWISDSLLVMGLLTYSLIPCTPARTLATQLSRAQLNWP